MGYLGPSHDSETASQLLAMSGVRIPGAIENEFFNGKERLSLFAYTQLCLTMAFMLLHIKRS